MKGEYKYQRKVKITSSAIHFLEINQKKKKKIRVRNIELGWAYLST